MDNFERRKVYNYTLKYLKSIESNRIVFNDFCELFMIELEGKNIIPSNGKLISSSKLPVVKKKLRKAIQTKLKELPSILTPFEKKCKLISEIYELDENEYEYLIYYVLKTINPIAKYIANGCTDEFTSFGSFVLHLSNWIIDSKRKSLLRKGILFKQGMNTGKLVLSNKIFEIFENPKIKTETQIKNILLGKNQKSELCWKDFEHIEKERDIAFNILTSAAQSQTKGINILLYGSVGTGKTQLAKLLANKAKVDMYSVSAEFMDKEASRKDRLSDLASKQTILEKTNNSCILFDEAEDVMNRGFTEFGSASKAYLNTLLEETPVPIFWTTNNIYTVDPAFLRRMTYTIEFEKLTDDIRLNIWKKVVRKNKLKVNKEKLVELNKNYDIPPSLISNAVKTTKLINGSQDDFEIFVENVAKVVTKKKNVKKKKEFEMKDYSEKLINTDLDISDLTKKIKSCGKLNFSLCLYGEPGTGKSLYARYLAKELGVEIIFKRASDLMSKYVGETEQNIADAFEEAKSKKAMLIFDEADSFLQNRNNAVRNWEVSQVNEMLTWMESHEYPFVCTTNLLDTLDEASLRRFTFKIKFDFMTFEQTNFAMEHFFGIKNANLNIKGLTAGDFATVKKKADFLCITDLCELSKMLEDEVKIKKSKELQNAVGF